MNTFNTIQDIFYSGGHAFRNDSEPISEIAFLVDENYLSLTTVIIATKLEYQTLLNNREKLAGEYEAGGGGNTHVALKILAKKYLEQNLSCKAQYEHPLCGFFPDVVSEDKTVVAECGHTGNPEKIFTYFKQGNLKEFYQIPYPADEDEDVKGYLFKASENLKDFLIFLEQEKRNNFKSLMQKNKNLRK